MRILIAVLSLLFAAAPLGLAAPKVDSATRPDGRWRDCGDDGRKFCKGVALGSDKALDCLGVHKNELSPACKAAYPKLVSKIRTLETACKADIPKVCKGTDVSGGRIAHCLRRNRTKVSPACREVLQEGRRQSRKKKKKGDKKGGGGGKAKGGNDADDEDN